MQFMDDAYANAAYIPNADRFAPHWEKAAQMFREQLKKKAAPIAISPMVRRNSKKLTAFHRFHAPKMF